MPENAKSYVRLKAENKGLKALPFIEDLVWIVSALGV